MKHHEIADDFGRRTVFVGEELVDETTDNALTNKPQWLDVTVWRTEAGKFVVRRTTSYRIRHATEDCARAEGYDLAPAGPDDTYPCPTCNKRGAMAGIRDGLAQTPRITVDVYDTPQELIQSFQNDGRYSNLARSILAYLSEKDSRVDAAWNTVVVP